RVSGRDQDATARVERVREVVAEPTVLAGCDAGGASLADPADVDHPPRGIGDPLLGLAAVRPEQRGLYRVNVAGLAVEIGLAVLRLGLVPDHRSLAGIAGGNPEPSHGRGAHRACPWRPSGLAWVDRVCDFDLSW